MPRQTSEGNSYSSGKPRHHHKPNQVTPSPARGVALEVPTTSSHRSTSSARKQLFYDTPLAKKGSCSEADDVNTSINRSQKNLFINRSNKRGRTSSSSISSSASVSSVRWDVNSISSLAAVSAGGSVKKSVSRLNSSKKKDRHHRISPTPGTYSFQQRFSSMDSLASCSSVANKKKKKSIKSITRNISSTAKESRRGRLKKKPIRHKHTIVSKHPKRGTTAAASNISTANNAAATPAANFNGLIPEDLKELIRPPGTPRKLRSPKEILQECEINSRPPQRESIKPRSCKAKHNINYNDERYDQNEFTDTIPIKEIQISPRTAAQVWPNTALGQRNRNSPRSTIQDNSSCSSNNNNHREIGTTDERTMTATAAASTAQSLLPRRSPRTPRSRSEQTAPATAATTAPTLPIRTARNHSSSQLAVKQHSLLVSPSNSKANSKQQQEQTMETPVPRLKPRARKALTDLEVQPEFPSTISNQQQRRLLSSGSPLLPPPPHQDSNSYREMQSNHFFRHEDHHTTISIEQQQPQQMLLVQRSGKDDNDRGQTNTQQKEKDPEPPIGTISIPRSPRTQSTSQHIGQEVDDDVVEKRQAGVDKATTARAGAAAGAGAANSASRNEVTRLKDPPLASVIEAVPDAVRTSNPTKTIEPATQSTQPAPAAARTSETAETTLAVAKKVAPAAGTKITSSKKDRKTSKTLLLPSPSHHKSALKKATKTALKKKATKKKKKKSRVRFAELPMTTTTYSIKVRVSTSSNSIESKRKKKKKKKKRHQEADGATANPLSHSEAHSIANQITQACIAQGRANNNNCVVECDDDGTSSDEETSSDKSSDEEPVVDNTANADGGGVVHNDEFVVKNNAETSNTIQGKIQEQIKDGQAENESGTEPSARNNRTAILEEVVQDGRRTPIEEDQDKGDGDGNEDYVSDGRSVTSELSMSTTQQGSSRTNGMDAQWHMHEGEMASREIEALEEPVAVVLKAKTLQHEEASPGAAAPFEGNRSAHFLLGNQNDGKVVGGQQQMQDSTAGRGDTATDRGCEMHNSQKEQRRAYIWHQSKRLRGGDSLAGSVSDSFRMSTKRARKDAASVCSSIRSKNRKGFSSAGSDGGSSRTSSKKAKKDAGSVCSSIRRKSRILACTESLASSLREEYGSQAGIANSLAPQIPMEVTVRERSEESVSQVKTTSDESSKVTSSSPKADSKRTSTSYSFPINSSHEADEIVDDAICSMGSSPKSLTTEKSPRRPVRNEHDIRSIYSDNSNFELGLTSLHASKMSEERLPSRAARYWIRKFEEKKARMKAAEKLKRIATVPVVTPTRKTGRRGRPPKSQKKKSPLHDMELPIPVGGSMESFRQSRKALRQLMYYDEADQDWV